MAREAEVSFPLFDNIHAQPAALREVAAYQFGPGRDTLQRSSELLSSSKRVILSGMGASLYACVPLAHAIRAEVIESSELLYFHADEIEPGAAVLLVSRSGESVEVTKLLPVLRARGCRIIGVTNVGDSALAANADEAVILNCPADQLVAIQTYTATVLTLLMLAPGAGQDQVQAAIDELASKLNTWTDAARDLHDFVNAVMPMYLLGRGPALGSVNEGALLFHETAKAPAVGMPAAQFRHGPVEVVDRDFRAIIFGTVPETLQLDAALAADLLRMGAKVCWIGPPDAVPGASVFPVAPGRFAPILETVPCQLLAYNMAEHRGIQPGSFRWAPAITRSETGFMFPGAS